MQCQSLYHPKRRTVETADAILGAALLWGNLYFCSPNIPTGIDHDFIDFSAAAVTPWAISFTWSRRWPRHLAALPTPSSGSPCLAALPPLPAVAVL
jgi:hypothetical protein